MKTVTSHLFLLLLLPCLLLTGCVQSVKSLSQDVDLQLDSDEGYLLIGVESSRNLNSILIRGPRNLKLTSEDLQKGSQYILISVPAGHYTIDKVNFTSHYYMRLDDDAWGFKVEPMVISYVGDFELKKISIWNSNYRVELENRSSEALTFVENKFPNILKQRRIRYLGPGDDKFFEFLENVKTLNISTNKVTAQ